MAANLVQDIIDSRYHVVEPIGRGGMGAVYRVKDRLTGQIIALKRVMVSTDDLTFGSQVTSNTHDARLALATEFRTLASLRHPHIVDVLDYGFETSGFPYFTMQLIEGGQPFTEYATRLDLPGKINLLVAILEALSYLHRHDIVHRDLKPANVLVTPDGEVKVMDFGLALEHHKEISNLSKGLAGTLAYMPPEILREEAATFRSDLYAVGIMAYEVLVGRHPFDTSKTTALVNDILLTRPDTAALDAPLAAVIDQLLAKDPAERLASADAVIAALCAATSQPMPEESSALRESFLQAAQFVGRAAELNSLRAGHATLRDGHGAAFLIAGETGVGKSRLLDELRIHALVAGTLVLRGQAIEGGTVPYRLWRPVVRRLLLTTEVSDLEAGVLRELTPDIEELLGRPVPDIALASEHEGRLRLQLTIVELFKRQIQPMVLLLDDLHWTTESLDILRAIVPLAQDKPLLIAATYRSDEAPYLYGKLPTTMRLINLHSLTAQEIEHLSISMLGAAGRRPDLVELLAQQTDGNIFFMIDVVRTLAERVSRLDDIKHIAIPAQVTAKSLIEMARRRLKRLPPDYQPMLRLAAVLGRELDFSLLEYVDDEMDYIEWLMACCDAAIIEVVEGNWRFTHDNMRQGILEGLADPEIKRLNRVAALAIEAVYPNNADFALRLVEHWHAAGDPDKEAYYAKIAGERKLHMSSFEAARRYFERALAVGSTVTRPTASLLEVKTKLATACYYLRDFERANQLLEEALTGARDQQDAEAQIRALFQLSQVEVAGGNLGRAQTLLETALPLAQALGNASLLMRVIWGLGDLGWRAERYDQAVAYLQQSLQLATETRQVIWTLDALNSLGTTVWRQGQPDLARQLYIECYVKALDTGNLERAGTVMRNLALLSVAQGDYPRAQKKFETALQICQKIGRQADIAACLISMTSADVGLRDMERARGRLRDGLRLAQQLTNPPLLVAAIGHYAHWLAARGDHAGALAWLSAAWHHSLTKQSAEVYHELDQIRAALKLSPADIPATTLPPHLDTLAAAVLMALADDNPVVVSGVG
jgi:tetratricopeptide (TPR) repeat protein